MLPQLDENNRISPTEAELAIIPDFNYSAADFATPVPYERLYELRGSPFVYEMAKEKMAANAALVGFKSFKSILQKFNKAQLDAKRRNLIPNQTEFDGQSIELNCGTWESMDWGIFRDLPNGGRECACAHPIMPISRLINIDTGEVKLALAFKPPGKEKKWRTTIVDKSTVSTARNITSLASQGISVTSNSASALVDYINDMENLNYDIIPEQKSIGRLGYVPGEGFSPFVDGLVFDGDASFRNLYQAVTSCGSQTEWLKTAMECRRQSLTARIMLAASFASPILSMVGSLPFFVHLWGVDSGTGKTVALMLAASVWGNPALGSYVQSFNGTQVGQERTAAFLNHLPVCLDELQLTKDSRGKSSFDVYQLAQGVGRARGKKSGGVEMTPTWNCCFLTTGESPLTFLRDDILRLALEMDTWYQENYHLFPGPKLDTIVPAIYGKIITDDKGKLQTTDAQRTGCSMCGFGIHREDRPHRFDLLWERNPKEWEMWMTHVDQDKDGNWFGWGRVLDYIGVKWKTPWIWVEAKRQAEAVEQLTMFE